MPQNLASRRKYFSELFQVHGFVMLGRHIYIHTAEPLLPDPSAFEFEMAIEKLKGHESPGTDQMPAGFINL